MAVQPILPVNVSSLASHDLMQKAGQPVHDKRINSSQADQVEHDLAKVVYFSPVLHIDVDTQTVVLKYRDAETGETSRQYPSEDTLKGPVEHIEDKEV